MEQLAGKARSAYDDLAASRAAQGVNTKAAVPNNLEGTLHGTGTRAGVTELSSRANSIGALRTQLSREGGTYEFVYLPDKNAFAINKKFGFTRGAESPHEYLRNSLTNERTTTVGGVIKVHDGKIVADEFSGHYGQNWTPEIRAKFTAFMEKYGFNVEQIPFGN